MDTAVRFMLAAILLLAMVNHAHADTTRDAEVVLEADEIDRSTVEVDDFVVVVYGSRGNSIRLQGNGPSWIR